MLLLLITFFQLAGLVVGLGSVTVIDCLGFCARRSKYFTLATIRSHKITKPLIWVGTFLFLFSNITEFYVNPNEISFLLIFISIPLILNGVFLSFYVSPKLIALEKKGKGEELLPKNMQVKIIISFLISFTFWWSSVLLYSYKIINF